MAAKKRQPPARRGVKNKKKSDARKKLERTKEEQRAVMPKCREFGGKKKDGTPCDLRAGFGTRHEGEGKCRYHGGNIPTHEMKLVKENANKFATPIEVTPGQALAGVLHLSAGQLQWTTLQVGALDEDDIVSEHGLVHPLVRFQRMQMLDLAKLAKIAHEAGIDERLASLAEEQTAMFAKLIEAVAEDLELTSEQKQKLGPAVRRRLTLVQGVDDKGKPVTGEVLDKEVA